MSRNVVCIKWGTKYSSEYVNCLARAVRRCLTIPYRFVCLTDDPAGIDTDVETGPFEHELPGWWNKIALFKSRVHDLRGTLLYLDLDMVVIRNIEVLFRYPGRFVAVPTLRREGEFASALMRFEIGCHRRIWDLFEPKAGEIMREIHGDQNWINACCTQTRGHEYTDRVRDLWPEVTPESCLIDPLPRSWFPDFKGELHDGPHPLHDDAKVIVFRGKPMVHEVDWVARLWRGEARVFDAGDESEGSRPAGRSSRS
jgi:hypothetical protein